MSEPCVDAAIEGSTRSALVNTGPKNADGGSWRRQKDSVHVAP
jgi:hypothetical protein